MTENYQTKQKGRLNPMVAAVTGAIIGAGITVAGAVVLSDKKNRQRLEKVVVDVKQKAKHYMEDMRMEAQSEKNEIKEKIAESKAKARKIADAAVAKTLN